MKANSPEYNIQPSSYLTHEGYRIASFMKHQGSNVDEKTLQSFGEEWTKFNDFGDDDISVAGSEYFDIVSEKMLNRESVVLDLGCGSGRWTRYIADRVACVEAVDPSVSVIAAATMLAGKKNVRVTQAAADHIPFADNTFDFVLCLGVLHHIPDTQKALSDLVGKLRPGGHALLYFYYNFENRGFIFKSLFHLTDVLRRIISSLPGGLKRFICDVMALTIYLPLVTISRMVKRIISGNAYKKIPLSYYVNKSFGIMRNDALDRFGTPLEKRYSKKEIQILCENAGLESPVFSEKEPFWHVVARKK